MNETVTISALGLLVVPIIFAVLAYLVAYRVGFVQGKCRADDKLRADAERYRWLAKNRCDVFMCVVGLESLDTGESDLSVEVDVHPEAYPEQYGDAKPHLDTAIDIARAEGGEK